MGEVVAQNIESRFLKKINKRYSLHPVGCFHRRPNDTRSHKRQHIFFFALYPKAITETSLSKFHMRFVFISTATFV